MIDWCTENGNPKPAWHEQAGSVYIEFLPAAPEVGLLMVLKGEMNRQGLQAALDLKDDEHFRKKYLWPAFEAGLIEMTIPDKPRSSKQRYRFTEKGRSIASITKVGHE